MGKYDEAFEFIDEVINESFDPMYTDNYIFEKGKLLFNLENYQEAKSVLSNVIILSDSANLRAFVWRAYSHALTGSCDSALFDLEFAVNGNGIFQQDYDKVLGFCNE